MVTVTNSVLATVLDANVLVALSAREVDKYPKAKAEFNQRLQQGSTFYAPGVIVSEVLYALCRRLADGLLTPAQHAVAVQSFHVIMQAILPPPNGDAALVLRAEQIRDGYGCSHSADGLYLALTEDLMQSGPAEMLTFDTGLRNQAASVLPAVPVVLLPL